VPSLTSRPFGVGVAPGSTAVSGAPYGLLSSELNGLAGVSHSRLSGAIAIHQPLFELGGIGFVGFGHRRLLFPRKGFGVYETGSTPVFCGSLIFRDCDIIISAVVGLKMAQVPSPPY
jgi:hypothetical protein